MFQGILNQVIDHQVENFNINGKYTIALEGAVEPGLTKEQYIKIPVSLLNNRTVRNSKGEPTERIEVEANDWSTAEMENISYRSTGADAGVIQSFMMSTHPGDGGKAIEQSMGFTGDEIALLVAANIDDTIPNVRTDNMSVSTRELYLASVIWCVVGGGVDPTGEFTLVDFEMPETGVDVALAQYGVDSDRLTHAFSIVKTLVYGAKVSYWQTNHHFGGTTGDITGPLLNALKATNMWDSDLTAELKRGYMTAMRRSVHPFSTRHMLGMLGWHTIIAPSCYGFPYFNVLDMDSYMSIRASPDNFPAGVRKYGLVKAGLNDIMRKKMLAFMPAIEHLDTFRITYTEIKTSPAKFHVGALYLSGEPSKADQTDVGLLELLGQVAQFVSVVSKRSSLAKAPAISSMIKNRENFSDAWDEVITAFSSAKSLPLNEKVLALVKGESAFGIDQEVLDAYVQEDDAGARNTILQQVKQLADTVKGL